MTGKLWQLTRGRSPHHLCLVGIELEAIRTHPAGDASRHCDTVVESREVASDRHEPHI